MKNLIVLFLILTIALSKSFSQETQEPYNILWLSCEDIGPVLSCYGAEGINTPNIDRLANEGILFNKAYATVGVCAPSRSSIITGMYPIGIGSMHMRTGIHAGYRPPEKEQYTTFNKRRDVSGRNIPEYSVVPPVYVKCFTEYLREEGYYCTNNAKCDYQFHCPVTAWDEVGGAAHYKNRDEGQPFFSVWNHGVTHESQIWKKKDDPLLVDENQIPIPDYYPNIPVVRQDVARKYSNILELDAQIGEWLDKLEKEGLLDKTIIFFWSDHGGPMLRQKRAATNTGLHVPLIVRFPDKRMAGTKVDDIVSLMDLGPTVLSLAGIKPKEYMDGKAFLGIYKAKKTRKYAFGSADRFDEYTDRVRTVNDGRFVYVRNFMINLPYTYRLEYREQMDMIRELVKMNENNELRGDAAHIFSEVKEVEELYDLSTDPCEVHNLAKDPKYSDKLTELRKALGEWQLETGDKGFMPEHDLINMMWPGMIQPVTNSVTFNKVKNGLLELTCSTPGASINYKVGNGKWKLYSEPISVKNEEVAARAIRIGFKTSEITFSNKK